MVLPAEYSQPENKDLKAVCGRWPGMDGAAVELISVSENAVFRVTPSDGEPRILRIHRPGNHSDAAIGSELLWLDAIRTDTGLSVSQPFRGTDGQFVQKIAPTAFSTMGVTEQAVLFGCLPGRGVRPEDARRDIFQQLGTQAAVLHTHARRWQLPRNFERPVWDEVSLLQRNIWGDWRVAAGVAGEAAGTIGAACAALRVRLAGMPRDAAVFGLIHADMRLGNILLEGPTARIIDFDDCGFGWFSYDFAAAISFHETDAQVGDWLDDWLDGYTSGGDTDLLDRALIPSMIMLRRMALLSWIGSHAGTFLAREHAEGFAEGTAALGETYLSSDGSLDLY